MGGFRGCGVSFFEVVRFFFPGRSGAEATIGGRRIFFQPKHSIVEGREDRGFGGFGVGSRERERERGFPSLGIFSFSSRVCVCVRDPGERGGSGREERELGGLRGSVWRVGEGLGFGKTSGIWAGWTLALLGG